MDDKLRAIKLSNIQKMTEEILGGHPDPIGLMKTWPMPKGPFLPGEEDLRHALDHYAADADIRARDAAKDPKDTKYADYQRDLICKCLADFLSAK